MRNTNDPTLSPLARFEYPRATMTIGRERAAVAALETLRAMGTDVRPTHYLPNGIGYIASDTGAQHEPTSDPRREAYRRGVEDAQAAATWIADANTKPEAIAYVLGLIEAGDDWSDYLPGHPTLSGEWADSETPQSLAAGILGADYDVHGYNAPDMLAAAAVDALADAYERGVEATFYAACEAELRKAAGR